MDRWLAGILIGFGVVFFANGVMIYFAVSGQPPLDPSYVAEHR